VNVCIYSVYLKSTSAGDFETPTRAHVLVTVDAFQADLALSEQLIELDARGQTPVKRVKRSTQQLQRRLRSLCDDRGDGRKSICHLF